LLTEFQEFDEEVLYEDDHIRTEERNLDAFKAVYNSVRIVKLIKLAIITL